jgi:imidazolonepropionase-like amidohydrolase
MGTIDGAKALMLDHEIGSLETGKLADIVIADAGSMEWQPRGKADILRALRDRAKPGASLPGGSKLPRAVF